MNSQFILWLLLAAPALVFAQNNYHTLLKTSPERNWVRTASTDSLPPGTALFVYQYGGATMFTDGNNIGQLSTLNGAGHYDLAYVRESNGDTLFLDRQLQHDYDPLHTQVVSYLGSPTVTLSTSLQPARPFDGRLGGVLFLAATDTLRTFGEVTLSATAQGFRGGAGAEANSDCSRFTVANGQVYPAGNWRGSARGEGIAPLPLLQEFGRAPATIGGGGANDHNAGGGGGANAGAGGDGARNILRNVVINNACRGNFPGRGATALSADRDRIFLGGGGGAGHANNTDQARGGNGGGLIVVWAPRLIFSAGTTLVTDGETPPKEIDGDGGGGGGAGGSILLSAGSLSGTPSLSVQGGAGFSVRNSGNRCFGPGGGGGGGRIVVRGVDRSKFQPEVMTEGGVFGRRLGSSGCSPEEEPGGGGRTGRTDSYSPDQAFGGFLISTDTLCGAGEILLSDRSLGAQSVTWEVLPASDALEITPLGASLRITYDGSVTGTFRAVQTLRLNGRSLPGDTATFTVVTLPTATIAVVQEEEVIRFSLTDTSRLTSIRYLLGDGTVIDTLGLNLVYTFTAGGRYPVRVTLPNTACEEQLLFADTIVVPDFAFARISLKGTEGCAPFLIEPLDASNRGNGRRIWSFPGGSPEQDTAAIPTVVYDTPGTYEVTLRLPDAVGPDTLARTTIVVYESPMADFDFTVDTAAVAFRDMSQAASRWRWSFGDGNSANDQDPVHIYDSTGTYLVTLLVSTENCSDTLSREVTIDVLSSLHDLRSLGIKLFPNPASNWLQLRGPGELTAILDLNGRLIRQLQGQLVDLRFIPAGTYLVHFSSNNRQYRTLIMIRPL